MKARLFRWLDRQLHRWLQVEVVPEPVWHFTTGSGSGANREAVVVWSEDWPSWSVGGGHDAV